MSKKMIQVPVSTLQKLASYLTNNNALLEKVAAERTDASSKVEMVVNTMIQRGFVDLLDKEAACRAFESHPKTLAQMQKMAEQASSVPSLGAQKFQVKTASDRSVRPSDEYFANAFGFGR